MKGERGIREYVEATLELQALAGQQELSMDIVRYEVRLRQARVRVKAAHSVLTGSQLGEARRRLIARQHPTSERPGVARDVGAHSAQASNSDGGRSVS